MEKADKVNASQYYNPYRKRYTGYDKGYAVFDGGRLYVHFDSGKDFRYSIGSADKNNTVKVAGGRIQKITTDQGITLYILNTGLDPNFVLIGRRKDGRFVKYIDSSNIFDKDRSLLHGDYVGDFEVQGDALIYHYPTGDVRTMASGPKFRFKWNDNSQWFGYERYQ